MHATLDGEKSDKICQRLLNCDIQFELNNNWYLIEGQFTNSERNLWSPTNSSRHMNGKVNEKLNNLNYKEMEKRGCQREWREVVEWEYKKNGIGTFYKSIGGKGKKGNVQKDSIKSRFTGKHQHFQLSFSFILIRKTKPEYFIIFNLMMILICHILLYFRWTGLMPGKQIL